MSNQHQKSTKQKSGFQDKLLTKRSLIAGTFIALIICATPFIMELHTAFPESKVWGNRFFDYESSYYQSIQTLAWLLISQLIPLILLFIWIFTNRHWWYHALIVPIGLYIYQILEILDDEQRFMSNEIIYLVPIMAIIVPSIYLIRARMFNKINYANKTLEELEQEFMIKPKNCWQRLKDYF